MKKFLYILILLIFLVIGINIGNETDETKAEIVKDKIEIFEDNIQNNNTTTSYNIEPNVLNKVANKLNNGLENMFKSVLRKILD